MFFPFSVMASVNAKNGVYVFHAHGEATFEPDEGEFSDDAVQLDPLHGPTLFPAPDVGPDQSQTAVAFMRHVRTYHENIYKHLYRENESGS